MLGSEDEEAEAFSPLLLCSLRGSECQVSTKEEECEDVSEEVRASAQTGENQQSRAKHYHSNNTAICFITSVFGASVELQTYCIIQKVPLSQNKLNGFTRQSWLTLGGIVLYSSLPSSVVTTAESQHRIAAVLP
jgi:hypothetical protein